MRRLLILAPVLFLAAGARAASPIPTTIALTPTIAKLVSTGHEVGAGRSLAFENQIRRHAAFTLSLGGIWWARDIQTLSRPARSARASSNEKVTVVPILVGARYFTARPAEESGPWMGIEVGSYTFRNGEGIHGDAAWTGTIGASPSVGWQIVDGRYAADIAAFGAFTAKDDFVGIRLSLKLRVPPAWAR